jgi:hypothetical protein
MMLTHRVSVLKFNTINTSYSISRSQIQSSQNIARFSKMSFRVVPINQANPPGWRLASCDEFLANRSECLGLISAWSICATSDGKCDGSGYGGHATKGSSHDGIGDVGLTYLSYLSILHLLIAFY